MFFISINIKYLNFTVAKFWVFFLVFTKLKPVTFFFELGSDMCYCFNGHRTDFWCFGSAVVSIGYESCNICFCFLHSEQRPQLPLNALDYAVRRHHRLWIRMRPRPVWAPHGCRRRSGSPESPQSSSWSNSWERWRNAPRVEPRSCHCGTGLLLA